MTAERSTFLTKSAPFSCHVESRFFKGGPDPGAESLSEIRCVREREREMLCLHDPGAGSLSETLDY